MSWRVVSLSLVIIVSLLAAATVVDAWHTGELWEWSISRATAYSSLMLAGYVAVFALFIKG